MPKVLIGKTWIGNTAYLCAKICEKRKILTEERVSLENIRASIKNKGAKWQAAVTSISKLGLDKPSSRKSTRRSMKSNPGSVGLPTSINWRNVNGAIEPSTTHKWLA